MSEEKNREVVIKKENHKALGKYVLILLAAMILGAVIGGGLNWIEDFVKSMGEQLLGFKNLYANEIAMGIPVVSGVLILLGVVICVICLQKCKKVIAEVVAEENEEQFEKLESKLSYIVWGSSLLLIFSFLAFSLSVWFSASFQYEYDLYAFFASMGVFVAAMCGITFLQKRVVDYERLLNPEKKGTVFDLDFSKKWMESSDEAEQFLTYKATYKAFQAVNVLCIVLWLLLITLGMTFGTNFTAVFVVLVIWAVMQSVYCYYSIQFSKKKNN